MKVKLLLMVLFLGQFAFGYQPTPAEKLRIQIEEKSTLTRIAIESQREYLRKKNISNALTTMTLSLPDRCDDNDDPGRNRCWDTCTGQNWGVDYCKGQCGSDTPSGQAACWQACGKANWGLSYCKSECGTTTSAGSNACWDKCTADNWGVSYCKDQCGTP